VRRGLSLFNDAPEPDVRAELMRCCGSTRWVEGMLALRPFGSEEELLAAAERVWAATGIPDWQEAITHHPRIGDVSRLRERFAATADWSAREQEGVAAAGADTLAELAAENDVYAQRFGFTFLVCATGKGASEMLGLLRERLRNGPDEELRIAAGEQAKITRLRLQKALGT